MARCNEGFTAVLTVQRWLGEAWKAFFGCFFFFSRRLGGKQLKDFVICWHFFFKVLIGFVRLMVKFEMISPWDVLLKN